MLARLVPDPANLGEIPIKRFYLPFVLEIPCETCGGVAKNELDRDGGYLSYPPVGVPFRAYAYCETCKEERVAGLILNFTLATCEPPPEPPREEEEEEEGVSYLVEGAKTAKSKYLLKATLPTHDAAWDAFRALKTERKRLVRLDAEGGREVVCRVMN